MTIAQSMYCKLYLDTDIRSTQVIDLLAEITTGSVNMRTINGTDCEIDVVENDDFHPMRRMTGEDQFLFYRYYLDILPGSQVPRDRYIKCVSNLLEKLWSSSCKAVGDWLASCPVCI